MSKKLLYVEISTAHTEIIGSFVEALYREYEVHLLINEKSYQRVAHLADKIKILTLTEENYLSGILKVKSEFSPDLLLLNSAQGRKVRDLCIRLFFDRTPVVGVHHNAENIYTSFTQKIIHFKIKKYIVLADFIKEHLKIKSSVKVEAFYPLTYHQSQKIALDKNFSYIAIPGVLEQDRRDYFGFVDIVKAHDARLNPRLKFVLLGNSKNHDGLAITQAIRDNQIESRFILFDHYVEDAILLSYVQDSLAVMPLMHPGTRWFDKYFETKISGAYNLAFAFNKKLLMHEVFKGKEEFSQHGVFYNKENFSDVIKQVFDSSAVKKPIKFEFDFQQKRLVDFLN